MRDDRRSPGTEVTSDLVRDGAAGGIAEQRDGVAEGVVEVDAFGAVAVGVDGDAGLLAGRFEFVFGDGDGDVRRVLSGGDEGEFLAADLEEGPGFVLIE